MTLGNIKVERGLTVIMNGLPMLFGLVVLFAFGETLVRTGFYFPGKRARIYACGEQKIE